MPHGRPLADAGPRRSRKAAYLAIALSASLPLTSVRAASADTGDVQEAVVADIAAIVATAAGAASPQPVAEASFTAGADAANAVAGGASVSVTDGAVVIDGAGAPPVTIGLPSSVPSSPAVAGDGSVVLAAADSAVAASVGVFADGSVSVRTVMTEAASPTSFDYQIGLPEGARLQARPDGGVDVLVNVEVPSSALTASEAAALLPPAADVVQEQLLATDGAAPAPSAVPTAEELQATVAPAVTADVVMGHLPAPWAVDATGTQLPTGYVVEGDQLTQTVDTSGAVFPVVADPFFIPMVVFGLGAAARVLAPAAIRAFAATTIRSGAYLTRGGFSSFSSFKRAYGTQPGYQWHHIVEQRHAGRFANEAIHHPNNLVSIPQRVHEACVNRWMASKNVRLFGLNTGNQTMREAVGSRSFSAQHEIGLALLRYCGVNV